MLADADRPFAENIDDKEASQISDDEMARMNIEISAGLQWWFNLQVDDGKRYWDLVERAMKYLPLGPKSIARLPDGPVLRSCGRRSMASVVEPDDVGAHTNKRLEELKTDARKRARAVSNTITNVAWRSGPIEHIHAGTSQGYALDHRRISLRDERAIIRKAQGGIYDGLQAMQVLDFDGQWPPSLERTLPFLVPEFYPSGWSHEVKSRIVRLLLPSM